MGRKGERNLNKRLTHWEPHAWEKVYTTCLATKVSRPYGPRFTGKTVGKRREQKDLVKGVLMSSGLFVETFESGKF